jgi:hypothetical protein
MNNETLKNYIDNIESHLSCIVEIAKNMQDDVMAAEGESDLHRKLTSYLVPNMNHWLNGAQAGGIKDLKELLAQRNKSENVKK